MKRGVNQQCFITNFADFHMQRLEGIKKGNTTELQSSGPPSWVHVKKCDDFRRYGWLGRHITPDCFFKTSHSSDESLQLLVLVLLSSCVSGFQAMIAHKQLETYCLLFHCRWMAIQHAYCIHRDTVDGWQASKLVSPWHQTDLVHLAKRTWNQYGASSLPNIDIHWHDLPWV